MKCTKTCHARSPVPTLDGEAAYLSSPTEGTLEDPDSPREAKEGEARGARHWWLGN